MSKDRYPSSHALPSCPGDSRPTASQIINDNGLERAPKGKTMLVTGGSSGLGVNVVRQLAKTGARVFFTSRDMDRGEHVREMLQAEATAEGRAVDITVVEMELGSLSSVKDGVEGAWKLGGFGTHFGVNHLAHFLLFQLLQPLLLTASTSQLQSRVVSVSSSIHTFGPYSIDDYKLERVEGGYSPFLAYAHSKTANIWFANELERRHADKGIHSISVHPGGITDTNFSAHHDPTVAGMMQGYLDQPHIKKALKRTSQDAASIVLAAVGKDYGGVGGCYMEDCAKSPPLPEDAPLGTPWYKPWAYNEVKETSCGRTR